MTTILILGEKDMVNMMASIGYSRCVDAETQVAVTTACGNRSCYSYRVVRNENEISSRQVMVFKNKKTGVYASYCPYCKKIKFVGSTEIPGSLMIAIFRDKQKNTRSYELICSTCLDITKHDIALDNNLLALIPLSDEVRTALHVTDINKCGTCEGVFV
jgi:hypothetical protein